jgi:hypothetical protein
MMTQEQVYQKSLAYLKNAAQWLTWPFVPVKTNTNKSIAKEWNDMFPVCGLVFEGEGNAARPTVVKLNMFQSWTPEQFEAAPKKVYDSIEAMLDDGWEVD